MPEPAGIETIWPDSRTTTDDGPIFTRMISLPVRVGPTDLRDLQHSTLDLPWLPRWWHAGAVALRRCLFLDTETTGVQGGSGTYAFLVGVGYVEDDHFMVKQFFLRELHEERAMLVALNELWRRHDFAVTFNGRSFDMPLLQTRYVMHRTRCGLPLDDHLDLLGPARRLWKSRLSSCALTAIERDVFGVVRHGDVPGAFIPTMYFNYLRRRDARSLLPVFDHNARDIATLAALAVYLAGLAAGVGAGGDEGWAGSLHPLDSLSLARIYHRLGRPEIALQHVQRALDGQLPTGVVEDFDLELAALLKRLGRLTEAVQVWERVASHRSPAGVIAGIELAKYFEHHARTYERASQVATRTLDHLNSVSSSHPARAAVEHRLRRLRWKMERTQPREAMG